ncbi:predicted protein [Naegleria gruberi]|uniref:Predicted protein n=1 Tax=Naegleria gruberi TaxID=5762 RepID=D2VCN4_NAEGR|nr:uncharacterized protein NAEGRDRAFT_32934 [Naegleria gruberi]EFC45336.1 predicted protein [Naegleria gruberi]|eukprot:XP_002678080.1 predicted protein [Naegleria gruberi strain NEG-M]
MFFGPHERKALYESDRQVIDTNSPIDYLPIFLSEAPLLFKSGKFPIDVALISVSPPDRHGFCSLGVSVDISAAAVQCAKRVIAQINPNMPRTHGDGFIHVNNVDCGVITQTDPEIAHVDEIHRRIGEYVAELIPNRACIQMGIGEIPNAICSSLINHTDLGIHTETMSDGVLELFNRGVITNKYKNVHPGLSVCSFVLGSKEMFDFVDDNPEFLFRTSDFVNDGAVIKMNNNMIAINSAIEIDLTGQVCADSIGTKIYSGVGGQLDFMSSSAKSEGGKPIIAIPSCTRKGDSKIVGMLQNGAGVVTTRSHIHYVCTEYGIAELYGKNMRQRARELIRVAHPKHRDRLISEAKQFYGL